MKNIKRLIFVFALTVLLCTAVVLADSPEITGTSVRVEAPVGIRVSAVIDTPLAESAVQEYGFIVARKVFLSGNGLENRELVIGCSVYYNKGISYGYENGEFVDRFVDRNDDETVFAAYLHGIPAYYYPEVFVVRPYAKMADSSSVYGEPVEVNLYGEAKKVKADSELYELLNDSQKAVIDGVIIAVEGEPYTMDRNDFRIVISSEVKKNLNPTYSVYYDLFNPYTGEILRNVQGRKKSRNYDEIEEMLLESGSVVPMYDGVVQDTADGYVADVLTSDSLTLIGGIDTRTMMLSYSLYDASLTCRECVKNSVAENILGGCNVSEATNVTVVNMVDMTVAASDIQSIIDSDKSLLCSFDGADGTSYADYVKAYVSVSPDGVCEYILVVVHPYESNASDITCLKHTYFDVGFYIDGGLYESRRVIYNTTPTLPEAPQKLGYTFVGWADIDGEIVNPENIAVTEDTEYQAVFEINTYSVVFYVNGEEYNRGSISYGAYPELPEAPEKLGYTFVGWEDIDGEIVNPESIAVTEDTEYRAVFEINTYSVVFYVNGEEYNRGSISYGAYPELPEAPQKLGYTFVGWEDIDGEIVNPESIAVTEDTEYRAVFEINTYSVVFYVDGEEYNRGSISYGAYPELPEAPEKLGYTFVGWEDIDGEIVNPESIAVTEDTEYQAVFEKEIVYYDVTFNFGGEIIETLSVLSGETASEPEFEPECGEYERFAGWSLTENGGLKDIVKVSETAIYADTDFYGVIETNPNSPEFLEKIQRGYTQLKKLKTSKDLEKQALTTIKECVGYIVDDALAFNFIDKNYAYSNYKTMVDTVKNIVKVQMTYEQRSAFVTFLTNPDKIDADVQDFIIDYFDINTNIN